MHDLHVLFKAQISLFVINSHLIGVFIDVLGFLCALLNVNSNLLEVACQHPLNDINRSLAFFHTEIGPLDNQRVLHLSEAVFKKLHFIKCVRHFINFISLLLCIHHIFGLLYHRVAPLHAVFVVLFDLQLFDDVLLQRSAHLLHLFREALQFFLLGIHYYNKL